MAVTLINFAGGTWGIPSQETGQNIAKIDYEAQPEINEWIPNIDGQARGKVVGDPMGKLSMEGETMSTNAGIMVAVFTSAFVPVNNSLLGFFGRSQGGWYPDTLKLAIERGVLQKVSGEFSSRFNVA